jgi:AcrR family transcriptional regulator
MLQEKISSNELHFAGSLDAQIDDPRRDRILACATRAFVSGGVDRTTLEDVALAAGVSKTTIYLFFANKSELLRSVLISALDEMLASAPMVLDDGENVEDVLGSFAAGRIGAMFSHLSAGVRFSFVSRLLFSITLSDPEIIREFTEAFQAKHSVLLKAYFHRLEAGGMVFGTNLDWTVSHFYQSILFNCLGAAQASLTPPFMIEQEARRRVQLFLYGVVGSAAR